MQEMPACTRERSTLVAIENETQSLGREKGARHGGVRERELGTRRTYMLKAACAVKAWNRLVSSKTPVTTTNGG